MGLPLQNAQMFGHPIGRTQTIYIADIVGAVVSIRQCPCFRQRRDFRHQALLLRPLYRGVKTTADNHRRTRAILSDTRQADPGSRFKGFLRTHVVGAHPEHLVAAGSTEKGLKIQSPEFCDAGFRAGFKRRSPRHTISVEGKTLEPDAGRVHVVPHLATIGHLSYHGFVLTEDRQVALCLPPAGPIEDGVREIARRELKFDGGTYLLGRSHAHEQDHHRQPSSTGRFAQDAAERRSGIRHFYPLTLQIDIGQSQVAATLGLLADASPPVRIAHQYELRKLAGEVSGLKMLARTDCVAHFQRRHFHGLMRLGARRSGRAPAVRYLNESRRRILICERHTNGINARHPAFRYDSEVQVDGHSAILKNSNSGYVSWI